MKAALAGEIRLTDWQLEQCRRTFPRLDEEVWNWVYAFTGVKIAKNAVCKGHSSPLAMFVEQVLTRPALALWHGPRGGGKSFLSAIDTHMASRFHPRHGTVILGGSKAQSQQIYHAIRDAVQHGAGPLGNDADSIARLLKTEATYTNGSEIAILAASPTSVRGPHVASVKLDEVDEIEPDIRESAMGMAMNLRGVSSSVLMTSTWHKPGGPMADLMESGRRGEFPVRSFCVFEVLERCPPERSGLHLEHCPACPIQPWCHSEIQMGGAAGRTPLPKAKRSDGHYAIEALIQKARAVSRRVLESDYLCLRPRASRIWFTTFDEAFNVAAEDEAWMADYVPGHPVHSSTDVGVWAGSVLFQVFYGEPPEPGGVAPVRVNVFGEYLSNEVPSASVARNVLGVIADRCGDPKSTGDLTVSTDSAAGAKNPVGKTVNAIFAEEGLVGSDGRIHHWDKYSGSVGDTLALVERLICSADGYRSIVIHPRCRHLINALLTYQRKYIGNEATDQPVDPQHPAEEMVDALRGGLACVFPTRLKPGPKGLRRESSQRAV